MLDDIKALIAQAASIIDKELLPLTQQIVNLNQDNKTIDLKTTMPKQEIEKFKNLLALQKFYAALKDYIAIAEDNRAYIGLYWLISFSLPVKTKIF
jgi:hypothetical protein